MPTALAPDTRRKMLEEALNKGPLTVGWGSFDPNPDATEAHCPMGWLVKGRTEEEYIEDVDNNHELIFEASRILGTSDSWCYGFAHGWDTAVQGSEPLYVWPEDPDYMDGYKVATEMATKAKEMGKEFIDV